MRDIALFAMLAGCSLLALHRAWYGVLALALVGAMHPQAYAVDWMRSVPFYKLLFIATCAGIGLDFLRTRRLPRFTWGWRDGFLVMLALLYADYALTTYLAILPEIARERLLEVVMLLPPLLLTLWLTDTREKLHGLIIATATGIALVALKGGYWAVMTGFQDRVYGPEGSQIADNNTFAVAVAMTIPLLLLWVRQTTDRTLRWVLFGAIALCYVAAITSWSRGGVVALAVMSALLVWHSQRKWLAVLFISAGVGIAAVNLPEAWVARMESISSYDKDQSFQGRQEAWRQGLNYLRYDPWTGSGFDGWRAITAKFANPNGPPATIDWHSAYVEAAVEHGIPGFLLWFGLLAGTMIALTRMISRGRRAGDAWAADHGAMLRAGFAAYAVGGLTLGITYWELFYQFMAYAWIALKLGSGGRPAVS